MTKEWLFVMENIQLTLLHFSVASDMCDSLGLV